MTKKSIAEEIDHELHHNRERDAAPAKPKAVEESMANIQSPPEPRDLEHEIRHKAAEGEIPDDESTLDSASVTMDLGAENAADQLRSRNSGGVDVGEVGTDLGAVNVSKVGSRPGGVNVSEVGTHLNTNENRPSDQADVEKKTGTEG